MMTISDVRLFCVHSDEQAAQHIIYVDVTNNLVRRVYQHREGVVRGFTQRYGLKQLVYFEKYDSFYLAIQREKNVKHWSRAWKLQRIESSNPKWQDLYGDITR